MARIQCPICAIDGAEQDRSSRPDIFSIDCGRWGKFYIFGEALDDLPTAGLKPLERLLLSHRIRWEEPNESSAPITAKHLQDILKGAQFPDVPSRANNIILWLGDHLKLASERSKLGLLAFAAIAGSPETGFSEAEVIIDQLRHKSGYLAGQQSQSKPNAAWIGLTLEGWDRYHVLHSRPSESKTAFFACDFNIGELTNLFKDHLQPAVKRIGYDLERVDSNPKAGLIDNKIRLDIQTARFVVADLTNRNPGVYMEAGYAEGLGRPVFFMCSKKQWDEDKSSVHFDAAHHLIIFWDSKDPKQVCNELTTAIQATLFGR